MTTPYRNDIDALRDRKDTLERELQRLREQASELETLRAREKELERELASVGERLGTRRALPMLDNVRVASPCNANWDEMVGDERVRFCLSCEKNVYNLSAMSREDAEGLLAERAGTEMCVRFYRRADGTMMTDDCPVGVKKKRRKKLALAVAGAGAVAAAAATAMFGRESCHTQGEIMVQGAVPPPVFEQGEPAPFTAPPVTPVQGASAPPIEPAPPKVPSPKTPPPKPHRLMGKISIEDLPKTRQ